MQRSNRKNESRMIDKPFRPANKVIVIGRKSKDGNNAHPIDTIFGTLLGKMPPVELESWMKQNPEKYKEIIEFWEKHALASGKDGG
ncbi:hypothetical protein [Endozoicomonas sp.]|uniref:hypothetical protein n=1 Tax=Endozoicomonas sp. TaxID=1892382 RepID=UPI00383A53A8